MLFYISSASAILFLTPALLFVRKSELGIALGLRPITSYKNPRRLTFLLISNILKHKLSINIEHKNFGASLADNHHVRAVTSDVLRRVVFGMGAFVLAGMVATFITLSDIGCV
jgi:hypothetical protein